MHIRINARLALALSSCAVAPIPLGAQRVVPDAYAITNARIVTVSGPTIERGTVVFRRGVITAVGATAQVPADARVIDGAGFTVYPGIIDAYGSLGIPAPPQESAGGRAGRGGGGGFPAPQGGPQVAAPSAPNSLYPAGLQPEVLAAELVRPDADVFATAHSAGVTTALTAPTTGIFMGQSALINLAGDNAQEMIVKSPIALHVGFTPLRSGGYPNSLMGVFSSLRQMLLDAQRYGQLQQAYAKNPRGMRRPDTDPSLAALQPVLARELPVIMLANQQREIERALDLAKEFNFKPIIAGGSEAYKVADRLKAENVPVLVSLNFPRRTQPASDDADPEPIRVLRERVEAPKNPGRLAQAGVRFAFESGGASWSDFLTDVSRAVDNGLTKDQAIRALTLSPAEILGAGDRLGSIETGKIANLVVVRGDLVDRAARVTQAFVDGRAVEVRAPAVANNAGAGANGTWALTVTLDGTDRTMTLLLNQQADQLRGTIQGQMGSSQISNASIGGTGEFRFTASLLLEGNTEEATFSGTATGGSMRGTVQVVGHPSGTFVGTRPQGGGGGRTNPPAGNRPPSDDDMRSSHGATDLSSDRR
jgi:imidazolonepropionase-like amidohydrolase